MAERQKGQSLVVGAAGAGAGFLSRLTCLTRRNTANATRTKSRTVLMNTPTLSFGAFSGSAPPTARLTTRYEKSTFPRSRPSGGIRTSFTADVTIFPNAPPMMIPIAMSRTLPRMANSLNSFSMLTAHPPRSDPGAGEGETARRLRGPDARRSRAPSVEPGPRLGRGRDHPGGRNPVQGRPGRIGVGEPPGT